MSNRGSEWGWRRRVQRDCFSPREGRHSLSAVLSGSCHPFPLSAFTSEEYPEFTDLQQVVARFCSRIARARDMTSLALGRCVAHSRPLSGADQAAGRGRAARHWTLGALPPCSGLGASHEDWARAGASPASKEETAFMPPYPLQGCCAAPAPRSSCAVAPPAPRQRRPPGGGATSRARA